MTIDLIRHGLSEGNEKRLVFGLTDWPLTGEGRAQALRRAALYEGQRLRVISSPLLRAAQTAQAIASVMRCEVMTDRRLVEQDMGLWENMDVDAAVALDPERFKAMMADWASAPPPGGEAFADMVTRVGACLRGVIDEGRDAVVVTHAGTLAAGLVALGLMDKMDAKAFSVPYAGGYRVTVDDKGQALGYEPLPGTE